jgi:hypothetical protein
VRAFCGFCSQEIHGRLVGCSTTGLFHERESGAARQIRPDHLIFFRDEQQALALGFAAAARPSQATGEVSATDPDADARVPVSPA